MGEKEKKLKIALRNAADVLSTNVKKNAYSIAIIVYMVFLAIWNVLVPLMIGEITPEVFLTLVMSAISIPVVILASLIITGKWKNSERHGTAELVLAKKQYELDLKTQELNHTIELKNQEIRHLQEIQTSYKTMEDLRKDLIFERTISEYQLRYVGLKANQKWIDTNTMLKEIDDSVAEAIKQREINATITPGE